MLILSQFLLPLLVVSADNFIWNTVKIGGGGYVIGLDQGSNGVIYSRTDVGGMYRYNESIKYWQPLTDWIDIGNKNLFGTDSFMVSQHDSNIIYSASGMYEWDNPAFLMKSTDGGNTWTNTNFDGLIGGGNENMRWMGERLCIHPDPSRNDTVYFGSRMQGLLRTTDGGNSWQIVQSFPFKNSTTNGQHIGIIFVNINPFNYNIYVYLYNDGIYLSENDGKSFEEIQPFPSKKSCLRSTFNTKIDDNLFYVTCFDGLYVYNASNNKWNDISPIKGNPYGGIDISKDGETIIVSEQFYGQMDNTVNNRQYYSMIYQYKWTQIQQDNYKNSVPWYWPGSFANAASDLRCDNRYNDCKRVFLSDWFVVWFNDNIYSNESTQNLWYTHEDGHEEVFGLGLASPKQGAVLISGNADVSGFRHINVKEYPERNFGGSQSVMGIDFCEKDTNIIVRVAGGEPGDIGKTGWISNDNGKTWNEFESSPPDINNGYFGGKIFISATNCDHIVWIPLSNVPFVSINGGKTWIKSNGAPLNGGGTVEGWKSNGEWVGAYYTHFMNDRINGNYFYLYDNGSLYVTNDGGFNWNKTISTLPVASIGYEGGYLSTDVAVEGHVCICLGFNGIFCNSNYGKDDDISKWNKMNGIEICRMITFGIGKNNNSTQSKMYYFGLSTIDKNNNIETEGMYIVNSDNEYERMNNNTYQLGDNTRIMIGDRQQFGRIYLGSNGRGIYYSTYVQYDVVG